MDLVDTENGLKAVENNLSRKINVEDLKSSLQSFGALDFIIFIVMLFACSAIGVYFAVLAKRKQTCEKNKIYQMELDYLVAGRKMQVIPVAISLIAR